MNLASKKILLLSTEDSVGGAYELLYRTGKVLEKECAQVCLAVKEKRYTDTFVRTIHFTLPKRNLGQKIKHSLRCRLGLQKPELAAVAEKEHVFYYGEEEAKTYAKAEIVLSQIGFVPDIVIVGLTTRFMSNTEIARIHTLTGATLVYIALDAYALTGGCHVANGCVEWRNRCLNCPAVKGTVLAQLPHQQCLLREKLYKETETVFLDAPGFSRRMLAESPLSQGAKVIPNYHCNPTDLFNDRCRDFAKRFWNLPADKQVILAGADNVKDPRKGRRYLVEALKILGTEHPETLQQAVVLLVGHHNNADEQTKQIPFETVYQDYIKDMRLLSLLYQACDIYVMTSLEETGPMMLSESMMCGTKVIAFQAGASEDESYLQSGVNGYRVKLADAPALAETLYKMLSLSDQEATQMAQNGKQTALQEMSDISFIQRLKAFEL